MDYLKDQQIRNIFILINLLCFMAYGGENKIFKLKMITRIDHKIHTSAVGDRLDELRKHVLVCNDSNIVHVAVL